MRALIFDNSVLHCHSRRNMPEVCHCEAGKDFFAKPKCEPATSHTCGVVEAIPLQATLVFGLLRYTRNDKKTRWPRGARPLAMTTCC